MKIFSGENRPFDINEALRLQSILAINVVVQGPCLAHPTVLPKFGKIVSNFPEAGERDSGWAWVLWENDRFPSTHRYGPNEGDLLLVPEVMEKKSHWVATAKNRYGNVQAVVGETEDDAIQKAKGLWCNDPLAFTEILGSAQIFWKEKV